MGYLLKKSSTTRPLLFLLVSSTDHITGLTGASVTVTISKAGGSFAAPSGSLTEIANGWYQVAANATDTNTNGPLLLHATAAGGDPTDDRFEVVSFDPDSATNLGLSNIDAAISSRSATGAQMDLVNAPNPTAITAIQSGLSKPGTAQTITPADSSAATTAYATIATNLNATVSSRSTYAGGAVASVAAPVQLDFTQAIPTSNTAQTVGDALNAARAQGFGKWVISGTTLTIFAADGTTPVRTFTLNSATAPTSRT